MDSTNTHMQNGSACLPYAHERNFKSASSRISASTALGREGGGGERKGGGGQDGKWGKEASKYQRFIHKLRLCPPHYRVPSRMPITPIDKSNSPTLGDQNAPPQYRPFHNLLN